MLRFLLLFFFCKFSVAATFELQPNFIAAYSSRLYSFVYRLSSEPDYEKRKYLTSYFFEVAVVNSFCSEDFAVAAEVIDRAYCIFGEQIIGALYLDSAYESCWSDNISEYMEKLKAHRISIKNRVDQLEIPNTLLKDEFLLLHQIHLCLCKNLERHNSTGINVFSDETLKLREFVLKIREYGVLFVKMLPPSIKSINIYLNILELDFKILSNLLNRSFEVDDSFNPNNPKRSLSFIEGKSPSSIYETFIWENRRELVSPELHWLACKFYRRVITRYNCNHFEKFTVSISAMFGAFLFSCPSLQTQLSEVKAVFLLLHDELLNLDFKNDELKKQFNVLMAIGLSEISEAHIDYLPLLMDLIVVTFNKIKPIIQKHFEGYGTDLKDSPLLSVQLNNQAIKDQACAFHLFEEDIKHIYLKGSYFSVFILRAVELHHACSMTLVHWNNIGNGQFDYSDQKQLLEKSEELDKVYKFIAEKMPDIGLYDMIELLKISWPSIKDGSSHFEVEKDLSVFLKLNGPDNPSQVRKLKHQKKGMKGKAKKSSKIKKKPNLTGKQAIRKIPAKISLTESGVENEFTSSENALETTPESSHKWKLETTQDPFEDRSSSEASSEGPVTIAQKNPSAAGSLSGSAPNEIKWGNIPLVINAAASIPSVITPPAILPASQLAFLADVDHLELIEKYDIRDILHAYLMIGNEIYVTHLSPFMEHLRSEVNMVEILLRSLDDFMKEVQLLSYHSPSLLEEAMRAANISDLKHLKNCIKWYRRRLDVAHPFTPSSSKMRISVVKYHLAALQTCAIGRDLFERNEKQIGSVLKPANTMIEPFSGDRSEVLRDYATINYDLAVMGLAQLLGQESAAIFCGAVGAVDLWAERKATAHQRPSRAELDAYKEMFADDLGVFVLL